MRLILVACSLVVGITVSAAELPGDKWVADYFRAETEQLQNQCLSGIKTLDDWKGQKAIYRGQLLDMLGLSPMPEKTDLKAVVTGKIEEKEFTVEKLYFQSMPHLYVTANLYLPHNGGKPAPTVLYLCGHAQVVTNGVSYGNKTHYQHHGAWFARNGYVCLVVDTLQLGEILGHHRGTYKEGQWWWNSRGYTPAGVEAWNNLRALDYLESRPEVDKNRIGVTGRSGGGAYSWVLTAIDDRIKCAAPVAGITDLQNYVVDGAVKGHCDCMFFVNTYRWDYPLLAALAAPRPLLLGNSDQDKIFPLDGIHRLHAKVQKIYELYDGSKNLGLVITKGPHQDTPELQVPVFHWFNRHLKGKDTSEIPPATTFFKPEQLRVFEKIPEDQINSRIQESFVPVASSRVPKSADEWDQMQKQWRDELRGKVFNGWPELPPNEPPKLVFKAEQEGVHLTAYDFLSESNVPLRFYFVRAAAVKRPGALIVKPVDDEQWQNWMTLLSQQFTNELAVESRFVSPNHGVEQKWSALRRELESRQSSFLICPPRGVGLSAWTTDETERIHIRRRFMLLGQTLDGMRVWDIRRTLQMARINPETNIPLHLEGEGTMAVNALYAAVFESALGSLKLRNVPETDRLPDYLNVLRVCDVPEAVAMVAENVRVMVEDKSVEKWRYPRSVAKALDWRPDRFRIALSGRKE